MSKLSKLLAAGIAVGVMLLTNVAPAFAAGFIYTPVNGNTVQFDKYLVMDEEANVPNVTFTFSIAPGEGEENTDDKLVVQAGDADAVTGTPVILTPQAVFAVGDETFDTVQSHQEDGTQQATRVEDNVELEEGQKYARKQVSVDFSSVSFSEPGVFRWVITEDATDRLGIANDEDATRYLDAYVIDNDGTLEVEGYVLHNTDHFQPAKLEDADEPDDGKANGYCNLYTTHNIDLSKTVTGNQGSRDQYFKFHVVIEGDEPGTQFDVDLSNADENTLVNVYSPESHENPVVLVLGDDGKVEQDFWLQNGQNIVINGIPEGASYTITETPEDYRVSSTVTEGGEDPREAEDAECSDDAIEGDTDIDYVNDKTGIIPTGVIIKILPFAIGAIAALAIGLFARKAKRI